MIDYEDAIGDDPEVKAATVALANAVKRCATRDGRVMRSLCIAWLTERDEQSFGCGLLMGDISQSAVDFMAEVLTDSAEPDGDTPDLVERRH